MPRNRRRSQGFRDPCNWYQTAVVDICLLTMGDQARTVCPSEIAAANPSTDCHGWWSRNASGEVRAQLTRRGFTRTLCDRSFLECCPLLRKPDVHPTNTGETS